jgi:hypothetical protein
MGVGLKNTYTGATQSFKSRSENHSVHSVKHDVRTCTKFHIIVLNQLYGVAAVAIKHLNWLWIR